MCGVSDFYTTLLFSVAVFDTHYIEKGKNK